MKLFMVRYQNGNSYIGQAEDEEQALRDAGIRSTVADVKESQPDGSERAMEPTVAQQLLDEIGHGPQNYTVRELTNFRALVKLEDSAELSIESYDEGTDNEMWQDYPMVDEVADAEEALADQLGIKVGTPHPDWARLRTPLLAAAVKKERERLAPEPVLA